VDPATHEELLEKAIEVAQIPEPIQNLMHTERQTKVSYNLAWAKTYLGKVGALENPSHVYGHNGKSQGIDRAGGERNSCRSRKQAKAEKQKKPKEEIENSDLEPQATTWKDQLLSVLIKDIKPDAFERLAQRILRESVL